MIQDHRDAFNVLTARHMLEVVDDSSTTFRSEHHFHLKAQFRTRFFLRQFTWTGSGGVHEPMPELICEYDDWGFPLQRIHGPVIVDGHIRTLLVDLGRTIEMDEEVDVHFVHRLIDLEGTFQPHLSVNFRPGMQRVEMCVRLPATLVSEVRFQTRIPENSHVRTTEPLEPIDGDIHLFRRAIEGPGAENLQHVIVWGAKG